MKRKLIIDGNAVYEIDEDCMLKKRMEEKKGNKEPEGKKGRRIRIRQNHNHAGKSIFRMLEQSGQAGAAAMPFGGYILYCGVCILP